MPSKLIIFKRISRRVIAEHHLALTDAYKSPSGATNSNGHADSDFVGQVFLKCNAQDVLERCGQMARDLAQQEYGSDVFVPQIKLEGHLDATFPYILSHLEYMVEEIFRNSIQAVSERFALDPKHKPAIKVLVGESPQHVVFRFSDEGGGIPRAMLPHIWSFSKGPRRSVYLENLLQVPRMAATMQELTFLDSALDRGNGPHALTTRPSNLKLGVGLPMCRVYAEYWAGSLELQSLESYGTDVFLHISKLGNKNEQLTTRAIMDKV